MIIGLGSLLHAKSLQLCPTLCHPMDCSLPGSSVHGDSPGKEYWSGLPCPPPGDLPNPGLKPVTLMFPALIGGFFFFFFLFFFTTCTVWEARISLSNFIFMWSVSIYICSQFFCVYLLFTNPGYLRWLAWTDKGEAPFWLTPRLLVTPMASVSQEEVNEIAKEKICSDYV